jgi:hypothetical protein
MIFHSGSTRSFYRSDVHGNAIPADAVEVSEERYAELMHGQASGQEIVPGPDGPMAQTPAPQRVTEASLRSKRDALLAASDWTQLPDDALSDAQRAAWRAYRQALRDLPGHPGWPGAITWPAPPA